jgi:hypothetical protein
MKKVFLSFADKRMFRAANRIRRQAEAMTVYDKIVVADEASLDADFLEEFRAWLIPGSRGFGYWCWKPQIVLQTLREMEDGDVLQWTDVGCHLNPGGRDRLLEYFRIAANTPGDVLGFSAKLPPFPRDDRFLPDASEFRWTKGDLFDYFGLREDVTMTHSSQIGTTTFFVKKSPASVAFVEQWLWAWRSGFHYADDSPSKSPNLEGFVQHRHDQSIFSLIGKIRGIETLSAFEYWYPHYYTPDVDISDMKPDWEKLRAYPVHAKRDKDMGPVHRVKAAVKAFVFRLLLRQRGLSKKYRIRNWRKWS